MVLWKQISPVNDKFESSKEVLVGRKSKNERQNNA